MMTLGHSEFIFLAATKQFYEWFSPSIQKTSVRPFVCPSVTPFYPSALWAGGVLSSPSGWAGGHLTLTLDFQGQILKMLYLRNGRADWHGTKGMWIDGMLHPLCDFQLSPHPWPWPWIFKVKFWKSHISGMGWPIDMELKGYESIECWTHAVTLNGHLTHDFYFGFSRSNFEKSRISGMGWPIDMERKGCESIGCYIYFVTFNVHLTHDLDLGFSRSNFENAVSQECNGRLTWNESDVNR